MPRLCVVAWYLSLVVGSSASMPQLAKCQGITRFPDSFFGTTSLRTLSEYAAFQKEIDATEEQVTQVKGVLAEFQKHIDSIGRQAASLGNEEVNRMFKEEHSRQAEVAEERLRSILRPKQFLRLRQIVLQRYVRFIGVKLLLSESIVEELDLSAAEFAAWKEVINQQDQRQVAELNLLYENRRELETRKLTPDQRAKFHEVYGERFAKADRVLPAVHTNPPPHIGPHLTLLIDRDIQKELEILADQLEGIKKLGQQVLNDCRELRALQKRHAKDKDAVQELEQRGAVLHNGVPKMLDDVLLPHQQKRLKQLLFQVVSQRQGGEPLRTPVVAKAIGMSQRQHQELIEALNVEAKRAAKKRVEIWEDVFRTCIEALTEEQQAKYHRLVGKRFAAAADL